MPRLVSAVKSDLLEGRSHTCRHLCPFYLHNLPILPSFRDFDQLWILRNILLSIFGQGGFFSGHGFPHRPFGFWLNPFWQACIAGLGMTIDQDARCNKNVFYWFCRRSTLQIDLNLYQHLKFSIFSSLFSLFDQRFDDVWGNRCFCFEIWLNILS